ncbi:DUF6206 family protein [Streptomyces sp. NBC_00063]|uniref:DUF6206 family protein n=1 Tax=Streptomyces sp. NBC_00063 TaxID=2975638 RepID=UPI003D71DFB8
MNATPQAELVAAAHTHIDAGIESGDTGDLKVVGFGEITLAVAWPTQAPRIVVKRLPPFRSRTEYDTYEQVLEDWFAAMRERGVDVVDTELHAVPHQRWGTVGYLAQPLLSPDELALHRVRSGTDDEAEAVLGAIIEAVGRGIDERVACDAQLPNWQVRNDGSVALMDVSTPFIRDTAGRDRLSTDLFVRGYPAVLRPALARLVLPSVIDAYHTPRTAVRDFAGNLIRLGLDRHLGFVLRRARERLSVELTEAEVRTFFDSDTRMWGVLQSLRRADKRWQEGVRRRPYPALLPPRYDPRTDYSPSGTHRGA